MMGGQSLKLNVEREVVELAQKPALDVPKRYRVWLHNDDYTPMEFVIVVLEHFFFYDEMTATTLMWQVHKTGQANCGLFTRDIAETKVVLVNNFARQHEHPLLCSMEQV
jgi:ATP-dependent Clp protease adaptor protein ClpS